MRTAKFQIEFTFKGEPVTKSNNTMWWKGKMRIPTRIRKYEKALKEYAILHMQKKHLKPTKSIVKMIINYFYGSLRRKDLQNLPKTTADALNKVCYDDDFQVHELHLYRHLDKKNPRVEIRIEEMEDSLWQKV